MTSKHDLTPPAAVAANARKGLELRERFGRGGTEVGEARAKQLAARQPVDPDEVPHIASYFARHEVDKGTHSHKWGDDEDPSAGYIAWLLWGGDEGRAWADALKDKLHAGPEKA
jgi:hypothetical protein